MEGYVYEVSEAAAAIKAAGRHLGFKLWPKSERDLWFLSQSHTGEPNYVDGRLPNFSGNTH